MTAVNLSWTAIVWRQVSFPQVTCAFTFQLKVVAEMLRVLHPQPLGSHNYLQFMQSLGNDLATRFFPGARRLLSYFYSCVNEASNIF